MCQYNYFESLIGNYKISGISNKIQQRFEFIINGSVNILSCIILNHAFFRFWENDGYYVLGFNLVEIICLESIVMSAGFVS